MRCVPSRCCARWWAWTIGTFDTSILPYEDCCTVFTPKHPKTRPQVGDLEEAEKALDVAALVAEAVDNIERVILEL